MAKIFVGLPIFNLQDPRVIESQEYLFKNTIHEVVIARVIGANVEHARQILLNKFLQTDCDYFFCMDADMVFSEQPTGDILNQLISHDKDIVGGVYVFKRHPFHPVFRPLDLQEEYERTGKWPENYRYNIPNELFEVQWMGGGFKMVKREVCEKVQESFRFPNLPMEYNGEYVSEDWAWDQRARECGFTVWADPAIKLGHIGSCIYAIKDYENGGNQA